MRRSSNRRRDGEGETTSPLARSIASPFAKVTFDDRHMPPPEVYRPLVDIFFKVAGQHFPWLQPAIIHERLESGTMSAFVLCGELAGEFTVWAISWSLIFRIKPCVHTPPGEANCQECESERCEDAEDHP
jgi:hypothetical protein